MDQWHVDLVGKSLVELLLAHELRNPAHDCPVKFTALDVYLLHAFIGLLAFFRDTLLLYHTQPSKF